MMKLFYLVIIAAVVLVAACAATTGNEPDGWSAKEIETLKSLSLSSLGPLPGDPSNRYADDTAAASLGRRLFFDTRMSSTGLVSCGSCHLPDRDFQDGVALAKGVGTTNRRTMPIAGTAYSPWLFWDGRKDNLWSQALGPLESAVEHGGTRAQYVHLIAEQYSTEYASIFGALPDLASVPRKAGPMGNATEKNNWLALGETDRDNVNRVFANIGKSIAAFERRIQFGPSRFDRYVDGVISGDATASVRFTTQEQKGLRLFIGRASCLQCHNGPLFTDNSFHNTGVPARADLPVDNGRLDGALAVIADEFNCRGRYSDANGDCAELEFMVAHGEHLTRAYKTPSLRGVADRAPFMHAGQIASLRDVLVHYNNAPAAPAGHSEIKRLNLTNDELASIEAFLKTLNSPVITSPNTSN
ncbi:MAG: hypothetical protein H7X80_08010 [bacterium]|nr:hypothetical protein [Candidatus Kapabacteria bacterium]